MWILWIQLRIGNTAYYRNMVIVGEFFCVCVYFKCVDTAVYAPFYLCRDRRPSSVSVTISHISDPRNLTSRITNLLVLPLSSEIKYKYQQLFTVGLFWSYGLIEYR
jgi:hypothetical protein